MANHILFVFEGEKSETLIFNSLKKFFLTKNTTIIASFCNDIYELYEEINEDPYLDLFLLLKGTNKNKATLSNISRDNVSEIFLFFDYDGHDNLADDNKVEAIIKHFDEETEKGKIYIVNKTINNYWHVNTVCV